MDIALFVVNVVIAALLGAVVFFMRDEYNSRKAESFKMKRKK